MLHHQFFLNSMIGAFVTLSPSAIVPVCLGGQVMLTCERMSGLILHWTVSIPRLAMTRDSLVADQGPDHSVQQICISMDCILHHLMSSVHLATHSLVSCG